METKLISKQLSKVVVFTCNWNAYSGLDGIGSQHINFPPTVHALRVTCLGQISSGMILKTFEKGALGVLLLGCPPDECNYDFGSRRALESFPATKNLVNLLGIQENQLHLDWVAPGDSHMFAEKVQNFVDRLNKGT
jgi:coenzyme F420-reducing hydrogenase delta subunit